MTASEQPVETLDQAISQQISLGNGDPKAVPAAVIRLYGEATVRGWVADLAFEVLNERAHELCSLIRRAHERQADEVGPTVEYHRDWVSVPTKDGNFESVRRGQMTVAQHLAVERRERQLARGHLKTARRARRDAQLIAAHMVDCLDDLPSDVDWPEAA